MENRGQALFFLGRESLCEMGVENQGQGHFSALNAGHGPCGMYHAYIITLG